MHTFSILLAFDGFLYTQNIGLTLLYGHPTHSFKSAVARVCFYRAQMHHNVAATESQWIIKFHSWKSWRCVQLHLLVVLPGKSATRTEQFTNCEICTKCIDGNNDFDSFKRWVCVCGFGSIWGNRNWLLIDWVNVPHIINVHCIVYAWP